MAELCYNKEGRLIFTKEMKKEYTILLPMMLPIHFKLIQNTLEHYGYKTELLETNCPEIATEGLKYVHNDTCYPAILVIGQFIHALKSGKYDLNKTALMITQTGGGCRASNYIHLLRKALRKAGFEKIPVISLNLSGFEKNSGFKVTIPILKRMVAGLVYGDTLMLLKNQTKPFEVNKGESLRLIDKWTEKLTKQLNEGLGSSIKDLKNNLNEIAADFSNIKVKKERKVKVGIVGEIYVKYSSLGNNNLEEFLENQGCEICVPGILNFMLFKIDNRLEDIKLYGGSWLKKHIILVLLNYFKKIEKVLIKTISKHSNFEVPKPYEEIKALVDGVIGYGNKMGEGWLLTAEMLELCGSNYENIVCTQPFGCLPNHICGKGMIHKIKEINSKANIVAIDYDPGSPKVNQENRIKLMLSIAKENLNNTMEDPKINISKRSTNQVISKYSISHQ
ncbi:MAG: hypothetical protein RUMPE_00207 [Eubacteriales bacterium SKADARSKE-1]|nr:hypothetical protein [Eubacteriales bacterium SKADARSKE-1]